MFVCLMKRRVAGATCKPSLLRRVYRNCVLLSFTLWRHVCWLQSCVAARRSTRTERRRSVRRSEPDLRSDVAQRSPEVLHFRLCSRAYRKYRYSRLTAIESRYGTSFQFFPEPPSSILHQSHRFLLKIYIFVHYCFVFVLWWYFGQRKVLNVH